MNGLTEIQMIDVIILMISVALTAGSIFGIMYRFLIGLYKRRIIQ